VGHPDSVGNTGIIFSAQQAAAALWTYGEDDLIDRALHVADEDLPTLWDLCR